MLVSGNGNGLRRLALALLAGYGGSLVAASAHADTQFDPPPVLKTVSGRYFWQKVGDFNNTNKESPHEFRLTYEASETIDKRNFLSEAFDVKVVTKYGAELSAEVKYGGVKVNGKFNYSYAQEAAQDAASETELQESRGRHEKLDARFVVDPGARLQVWQLVYEMPGVTYATKTITDVDPGDSVPVDIQYSLQRHIVGLPDILKTLADTRPGSSNVEEWRRISDNIVQNSALPREEQFYKLVQVLNDIRPSEDNIEEWGRIRDTCGEILQSWNSSSDKQALFIKLLYRFSTTHPGHDNIDEWRRISDLSSQIIQNTQD